MANEKAQQICTENGNIISKNKTVKREVEVKYRFGQKAYEFTVVLRVKLNFPKYYLKELISWQQERMMR